MTARAPRYLDIPITVPNGVGYGSTTKNLLGTITRGRIIPPNSASGAYSAHAEDEVEGLFAIPDDARPMDGVAASAIRAGDVTGPTTFFITNTALFGIFTLRIWGSFSVVA